AAGKVKREQRNHAGCLLAGMSTPWTINHAANANSNTSIGSHVSHVSDDDQFIPGPNSPAVLSTSRTTSSPDANTPSRARADGIIRPFRSSQQNRVLPTEK